MASQVTRFGVFIASPSDVSEERDIVVETINRWNVVNWYDRGIQFVPLRYETGSVPTQAATPQAAINDQLLNKADYLIGIFWSRLGTHTEDYPSGTVEEIETKPPHHTSVYFKSVEPSLALGAPDAKERLQQYQDLKAWHDAIQKKSHVGTYKDPSDLGTQVFQLLETWASNAKLPPPPIKVHQEPSDYTLWLREWNDQEAEGTILLYNIELTTFRDVHVFAKIWGALEEMPNLSKVILLLPSYKTKRLERYLKGTAEELRKTGVTDRIQVCELTTQAAQSGDGQSKVATSLAFALFRFGCDPGDGQACPRCHVFTLSEPFSSAAPGDGDDPDVAWRYNYSLETGDEGLAEKLLQVWDSHYNPEHQVAFLDMLSAATDETAATSKVEQRVNHEHIPSDKEMFHTIRALREKLFDPNVPSYLLDKHYLLLDWNPAFEMIFPTSQFYRKESVMEFVKCLKNREEVARHGMSFYEQRLVFDIESLEYQSPRYGHMRFRKIASEVRDPVKSEALGWVIALNVNEVENLARYESDVEEVNIDHGIVTLYAYPFNKIIKGFPGYIASVDMLARCMNDKHRVLDLGAGPGLLTLKLLEEGKRVTAVDQNDAMLDILRTRCQQYSEPELSVVKANIKTLHAPNIHYEPGKVGVDSHYDGAVMLNVMRWLSKPAETLKTLSDHLLDPGSTVAFSLLTSDEDIQAFKDAVAEYCSEKRERGERCWSSLDYETFQNVIRKMEERKILGRHTEEDVRRFLDQAEYTLEDTFRAKYTVRDRTYEGATIFVARSPEN